MDDPVKGEGRMITDASGVTRREGGILGMWSNIFPERNGRNEQKGDSTATCWINRWQVSSPRF